jgi:broad specificity phosphatase PhoE
MRLFVVRHGQTAWNHSGRAQGHTDISLDMTGLDQVRMLHERFENEPIDRILCSDLTRCRQTAEPIVAATGAPIEYRTDLRERSFGQWEGSEFTQIAGRLIERSLELGVTAQEVRPPNGESFVDVWNRVAPLVASLFESDEDTVIVTHGGTASVLLAQLVKGTLETQKSFRFANTGVTELYRRSEGLFAIQRYNDTSHLDGLRAVAGVANVAAH